MAVEHEFDDSPSYPVVGVSKEDLLSARPDFEAQIAALTEGDMERIADKLGDALMDTYWLALDIIFDGSLPVTEPLDDVNS